jgi:hypothetical protein
MTTNIQNWSDFFIEESWIPDEKVVDGGVTASWVDRYLTVIALPFIR